MGNTVLVELKNHNALNLLHDLEKMDIIHIVEDDLPKKINIADRFVGVISKEQAKSLRDHIKTSREAWDRDIF